MTLPQRETDLQWESAVAPDYSCFPDFVIKLYVVTSSTISSWKKESPFLVRSRHRVFDPWTQWWLYNSKRCSRPTSSFKTKLIWLSAGKTIIETIISVQVHVHYFNKNCKEQKEWTSPRTHPQKRTRTWSDTVFAEKYKCISGMFTSTQTLANQLTTY